MQKIIVLTGLAWSKNYNLFYKKKKKKALNPVLPELKSKLLPKFPPK
jgi:hypothetical protein